ncbi:MAG TPA: hypothetical protein VN847_03935 [Streptosporangiaceae bacterium]|nr:hypothetical protein [Streptosporangiaceae bacterium]
MSHQGPRRYRQPDVHGHPAPEPPTASTGPDAGPDTGEFAAVSGYAELTAYRRAGYAGFPDQQGFPPPPYEQPVYQEQPAYEEAAYQEQAAYQGRPAYQGRHSGPIPAPAPGRDPGVHQTPATYGRPAAYPPAAPGQYEPPESRQYQPPGPAHYQPPAPGQYRPAAPHQRVRPGPRGRATGAITRTAGPAAPAGPAATATYAGPDSDEFAAPVINPAPVDAPPVSDGRQDPAAYAGLRKPAPESRPEMGHRAGRHLLAGTVTGLLAAAVAISGSVLAAMLLRPLKSPVSAVAAILRSTTVANFAGEHFGSREHVILLALPWLASAVAAVIIGLVARRHRVAGVIGIIAFFGVAGAFVAATRPGSHAADVVPSLVGGVAGAVALVALASVLIGPAAAGRDRSGRARS